MKVGIYSPYLDTLGGGERYILTIANLLSQNHQVTIFWDDPSIRVKVKDFLAIDLTNVSFAPNIFSAQASLIQKVIETRKLDLLIFLSDGSIPFSLAKKTILHFQEPFNFNGRTISNRLKLRRIAKVIVNSLFTKKFIDQTFGVQSLVLYPPCNTSKFRSREPKKNMMVSLGRFEDTSLGKKQEVLIRAFKDLNDKKRRAWQLFLVGSLKSDGQKLLGNLQNEARGYPIKILPNLPFESLTRLFAQAKIYWHAKGFLENEKKDPQNCEHFGIAVVEAMASGCVPIVVGKGGLKEIIQEGKDGFFWQDKNELIKKTVSVMEDENLRKKIAKKAISKSQNFSTDRFRERFEEILDKI